MTVNKVYLVSGKRTPFGKFGGSLCSFTPVDLASFASKDLLDQTNVSASLVDHVIFGNVVTASTDTMYAARHVALRLGCKITTPAYNLNRLCGSGLQVILDAARMIKLGEASCVLSCGAEAMSMIPHLVYGSRFGTKYGELKTVDMLLDALTDKHSNTPMGITAENLAKKYSITRQECDEFSVLSHQKASKAYEENLIQGEITSVALKKSTLNKDEHLREDANIEQMQKLRSSFVKDGVVTPASASGIVDGGAACLIASEKFVLKNKLTPLAEIVDGDVIGVDPQIMGIGPVPVIQNLLSKNEKKIEDIALFEINEAFSAQLLAVSKELNLPLDKINIWGGAIALGHPLGATGLKITLTLARQLQNKNLDFGISSACIGGGQGIGILLKKV
ncbi:thiolase family protein [bacterium]|nr:thiolase family protein [bacterium]